GDGAVPVAGPVGPRCARRRGRECQGERRGGAARSPDAGDAHVTTAALETNLSRSAARALYDRIGRWQDTQRFYEDRATANLIAHADLGNARSVVEFGAGTGRLAERLLRDHLPASAPS